MNIISRKLLSVILSFSLIQMNLSEGLFLSPAEAFVMPSSAGSGVLQMSPSMVPPVFRAVHVNPLNPFELNFIIDSDPGLEISEQEVRKLVKYFLTVITVPEDDLWVNLSPYEPEKIMDGGVARTDMGRDMLLQDYLLKQFASSLTFPESGLGKEFWNRVAEQVYAQYGKVDLPEAMFNKVWIVPGSAQVSAGGNTAWISESRLNVMTEQDYLASEMGNEKRVTGDQQETDDGDRSPLSVAGYSETSQIFKDIILPEIIREVNEGEHFASIRQVYHSVILALWFKTSLKNHLIHQIYGGRKVIDGLDVNEASIRQDVYKKYMEAFQQGTYDLISEDYDPHQQAMTARHYFSGGIPTDFFRGGSWMRVNQAALNQTPYFMRADPASLTIRLQPSGLGDKFSNLADRASLNVRKLILGLAFMILSISAFAGTVSRGDRFTSEDQTAIEWMQQNVTPRQVKAMEGKVNPVSGKKYVDAPGNAQTPKVGEVLDRDAEWFIVTAQHLLGVRENGKLNDETRAAIEKASAETGPSDITIVSTGAGAQQTPGGTSVGSGGLDGSGVSGGGTGGMVLSGAGGSSSFSFESDGLGFYPRTQTNLFQSATTMPLVFPGSPLNPVTAQTDVFLNLGPLWNTQFAGSGGSGGGAPRSILPSISGARNYGAAVNFMSNKNQDEDEAPISLDTFVAQRSLISLDGFPRLQVRNMDPGTRIVFQNGDQQAVYGVEKVTQSIDSTEVTLVLEWASDSDLPLQSFYKIPVSNKDFVPVLRLNDFYTSGFYVADPDNISPIVPLRISGEQPAVPVVAVGGTDGLSAVAPTLSGGTPLSGITVPDAPATVASSSAEVASGKVAPPEPLQFKGLLGRGNNLRVEPGGLETRAFRNNDGSWATGLYPGTWVKLSGDVGPWNFSLAVKGDGAADRTTFGQGGSSSNAIRWDVIATGRVRLNDLFPTLTRPLPTVWTSFYNNTSRIHQNKTDLTKASPVGVGVQFPKTIQTDSSFSYRAFDLGGFRTQDLKYSFMANGFWFVQTPNSSFVRGAFVATTLFVSPAVKDLGHFKLISGDIGVMAGVVVGHPDRPWILSAGLNPNELAGHVKNDARYQFFTQRVPMGKGLSIPTFDDKPGQFFGRITVPAWGVDFLAGFGRGDNGLEAQSLVAKWTPRIGPGTLSGIGPYFRSFTEFQTGNYGNRFDVAVMRNLGLALPLFNGNGQFAAGVTTAGNFTGLSRISIGDMSDWGPYLAVEDVSIGGALTFSGGLNDYEWFANITSNPWQLNNRWSIQANSQFLWLTDSDLENMQQTQAGRAFIGGLTFQHQGASGLIWTFNPQAIVYRGADGKTDMKPFGSLALRYGDMELSWNKRLPWSSFAYRVSGDVSARDGDRLSAKVYTSTGSVGVYYTPGIGSKDSGVGVHAAINFNPKKKEATSRPDKSVVPLDYDPISSTLPGVDDFLLKNSLQTLPAEAFSALRLNDIPDIDASGAEHLYLVLKDDQGRQILEEIVRVVHEDGTTTLMLKPVAVKGLSVPADYVILEDADDQLVTNHALAGASVSGFTAQGMAISPSFAAENFLFSGLPGASSDKAQMSVRKHAADSTKAYGGIDFTGKRLRELIGDIQVINGQVDFGDLPIAPVNLNDFRTFKFDIISFHHIPRQECDALLVKWIHETSSDNGPEAPQDMRQELAYTKEL